MTDNTTQSADSGDPAAADGEPSVPLARRTVLRAAGASAALLAGTGLAGARRESPGPPGDTPGRGPPEDTPGRGPPDDSPAVDIDPVFGKPSAGPNPCAGDADDDCLDEVRPGADHEVELQIDLPELLLAVGEQGVLSKETLGTINEDVADGEVTPDSLHKPGAWLSVDLPGGGSERVTVEEVARLLADTVGFHFDPAGLHVEPGSVVLFSGETPDHGVAAYHERHGRQNRVPGGVGPITAPLVPVGGYWLYRFTTPGVYDCYCPPHDPFGMVLRVVVSEGDVPNLDIENTGRPPPATNSIASVLGGLDPNLPSSMDALNTHALAPDNIVDEGEVSWEAVVAEHRSSS